jgi:hypothetical protein
MPQSARIRPALTEPIFGSAKRTSRTLAVRRHSGGWARISASSILPDARSFFSCALANRISLASRRARRRCSRDLPETLAFALPADTRAILGTAPGGRSTVSAGDGASRRQRVSPSVGTATARTVARSGFADLPERVLPADLVARGGGPKVAAAEFESLAIARRSGACPFRQARFPHAKRAAGMTRLVRSAGVTGVAPAKNRPLRRNRPPRSGAPRKHHWFRGFRSGSPCFRV